MPMVIENLTIPTACLRRLFRWQNNWPPPLCRWPTCHGDLGFAGDGDGNCAANVNHNYRLVTYCGDLWRQVTARK